MANRFSASFSLILSIPGNVFSSLIHLLTKPVAFFGLVFYPSTWVLISMQLILIVKSFLSKSSEPPLFPSGLLLSMLLPLLLIQAVKNLLHFISIAGNVLTVFLCLFYFLLTLFFVTEDAPFDYSLLHLNADLLSYKQSWILLFERLNIYSYIVFIFYSFLFLVMIRTHLKKKGHRARSKYSLLSGTVCLALYSLLINTPLQNMDQFYTLYHSYKEYSFQQKAIKLAESLLDKPFPYVHIPDSSLAVSIDSKDLPHIFLVCLESCNGTLIEKRTGRGDEITPFFNSLISQGVYAEHFYGNSVQTARGFFALLTGNLPGFRKKEFTSMTNLNIRSLPAILSEYGYRSYFIKAYHDLNYDNTGEFMKKAGFHNVWSMTEDILDSKEKENRWGWGLQDDYFYRKIFRMLDKEWEENSSEQKRRPLFVTTLNVSNHMMFNSMPANQKYLYPDAGPEDYAKNFRNSMFLSDSCLREFFVQLDKREWLRNSIIVIVGDHGFPSGEHTTKNEKGAWEENFRTPILFLWRGHLKPLRLSGRAYSQIDLMPTLFDLLDLNPAHHSVGKSVFDPGEREPVLLTQPYDGIYLVSVDYPFKMVKRLRGNFRAIYNLSIDPGEKHNLINQDSLRPVVIKLQESLMKIMMNQVLLESNRIWPGSYN